MGCQLPALPELGIQRPPQEARDTPNGRGAQARGRKQPRRGGQTQSFGHPLPPDTRRFHRCGGKPGRNALPGRAGLHGRRSCRTGHLHYAGPYQPHGQRLRAQFGIHDRRPPGVGTRQGGRPEIEKLRPPAAHAQKQLFGDDLCGRETHRPVGADQRTRSLQLYGHTVQPRRLRRFPVLGGRQRAAGQRRFVCALPAGTYPGLYRRHVRRHPGGRGAAARRLEPQLAPLPQRQPGYFQRRPRLEGRSRGLLQLSGAGSRAAGLLEQSQRPHVAGLFGLVQPVFRRREWLRVDDAPRIRRQGEDRLRVRDLLQPKRLSLPHTGAVFPGAGRAVRLNVDVYHAGIRPLPLRFAFPEPHVHAEKSRQLHRGGRNLQIHPAGTDV